MEVVAGERFCIGDLLEKRYRVRQVLGEGATGIVVLAADEKLDGHQIALKFLHPHLIFSPESLARFRNEIRVTMSLNHAHILQCYGLGQHSTNCFYLKMEYLPGNNLAEELKRNGSFSLDEVVTILRDLADALEYAHRSGVIHRDLKPENILLNADARAKIADFGLAQMFRTEARYTGYGDIIGTPFYMSPEQLRSEAVDARCDMYSFGILAYELITGRRPFEADSFIHLAELHLEEALPVFKAPEWLESLIRKCANKNRLDRFVSMQEVHAILDEHCETESLSKKSSLNLSKSVALSQGLNNSNKTLHYRIQKLSSKHFIKSMAIFLIVLLLAIPWVQKSARWRFSAAVLWIEQKAGTELVPLRLIFNTPLDLHYPESLFGPHNSYQYARHYIRPIMLAGLDINIPSPETGTYPVQVAASSGHAGLLLQYLEGGARPNLSAPDQMSVLGRVVRQINVENNAIEKLIEAGANPNPDLNHFEHPLVVLVRRSELEAARLLLAAGANPNAVSDSGVPLIHLAVNSGSYALVSLVVDYGAKLDQRDQHGRTALEYAKTLEVIPEMKQIISLLQSREN